MQSLNSRTKRPVAGCIALILGAMPVLACADEFDTFQLSASVNKTHDNNIFRQNTNVTSDDITIKSLGVVVDKSYSLQRFIVNATFLDYKYNQTSFLDYQASNYSASWLWSLTPNLTGTLSSDQTEALNDFRDFISATPIQNIRTSKINKFRAEYSPHHVWSLIAGATETQVSNSQQFNAQADFDAMAMDYGAKYSFPSGASVTFLGHKRTADYKNRVISSVLQFDNGYQEDEFEVDLAFKPTGKTNLSAKVGHISREYDNFTLRNYDAYLGYINYNWLLTGKLKATINASRLVSPYEQANSTYSVTDAVRCDLTYLLHEKIEIAINTKLSNRDFEGRGQFNTSGRTDHEQSYGGSIKWSPIKNISLSVNTTKSSRNSTVSRFDFDDTLSSINLDLKL